MTNPSVDCLVIGAGLSGLVCAYRLAKRGARVLLVDSASRAGGVIGTRCTDGFLLEDGPNSFASSPAAMHLLEELELRGQAQVLPMQAHDRYIWRSGRLRKVPTSPGQFAITDALTMGEKMRTVQGFVKRLPPPAADVELGTYLRARLGDGIVEAMVKPGLAGIYAADADSISFQSVMPKVFEHAQRSPRLVDLIRSMKQAKRSAPPSNGPRSIVALDTGMQTLLDRLVAGFLENGGRLELRTRVGIASHNGYWGAELTGGEVLTAGQVVVATPAGATASLLHDVSPPAAEMLAQIPYAPLAVVQIGLREDQLAEKRDGFGFLSMRNHGLRALGIIWSDRMFKGRAPAGHRLLTCFYGGQLDPTALHLSDDELKAQVIADLKLAMGFARGELELFRTVRLERALPIFRVGHAVQMQEITSQLPKGIHLLSNYTGGVSIPDRIGSAAALAKKLMGDTDPLKEDEIKE